MGAMGSDFSTVVGEVCIFSFLSLLRVASSGRQAFSTCVIKYNLHSCVKLNMGAIIG